MFLEPLLGFLLKDSLLLSLGLRVLEVVWGLNLVQLRGLTFLVSGILIDYRNLILNVWVLIEVYTSA